MRRNLTDMPLAALASGSSGSLSAVKGVTPEIIEAGIDAKKSVYARGFQLIFLVCLAFAGGSSVFRTEEEGYCLDRVWQRC